MSLMRAFVLDDEPLAVERLVRLLRQTGRVDIVGTSTDPLDAIEWLRGHETDVLFLDIEMPGFTGFAVLERLDFGDLRGGSIHRHTLAQPADSNVDRRQ